MKTFGFFIFIFCLSAVAETFYGSSAPYSGALWKRGFSALPKWKRFVGSDMGSNNGREVMPGGSDFNNFINFYQQLSDDAELKKMKARTV